MCSAASIVFSPQPLRGQGSRVSYALGALQQRIHHLNVCHFSAKRALSNSVFERDFTSRCSHRRLRTDVRVTASVARGRHVSTYSILYASTAEETKVDGANALGAWLDGSSVETQLSDFESSAHAKWASDAAIALNELPEQGDLASLGLCANTPVGWLQSMLEYLHVHAHLPWWGAIVASTIALRVVIFPVMMKIQKNGVIMNNISPEIQKLIKKQRQYRQMGNKALYSQYSQKVWQVYKRNNCNPLKMAVMPLVQLPLFLSFFIAIRKMAAVPVESMKTGGILWFEDLTVPDPYYILPVLACGSFVASIEVTM